MRWWALDELETTPEELSPRRLPELLRKLLSSEMFDEYVDRYRGRLVGALPLCLRTKHGLQVLSFISDDTAQAVNVYGNEGADHREETPDPPQPVRRPHRRRRGRPCR